MKKNRITTTSIREIKSSFKRFLSLLVMSLLGVGVFVGITATAPDMIKSLDTYYDNNNVYDIKLISSLGLTKTDISEIKKLKGIGNVEGAYSKDVLVKASKSEYVVKALSISNNINKINLIKGNLPKKDNEILVEESLLKSENLKLNDIIKIEDNTFSNTNLKIVGIVKSALYINNAKSTISRGNTNLGNGKISYYVYMNSNNYNLDYYTELYITLKNSKNLLTTSSKYENLISNGINTLNSIKKERQNERYNEIYNKINDQINSKESEGNTKLNSAKIKLNSAKAKLNNAKNTLDETKNTLEFTSKTLDNKKQELDNAKKELDFNKSKLDNANSDLEMLKSQIDFGKEELNNKLIENNLTKENALELYQKYQDGTLTIYDVLKYLPKDKYQETFDQVKEILIRNGITIEEINEALNNPEKLEELISNLPEEDKKELIDIIKQYESTLIELKEKIDLLVQAEEKYENGKSEYDDGLLKYNYNLSLYNSGLRQYEYGFKEFQNGLNTYNNYLKTYNSNLNIYNSSLEEYNDNKILLEINIIDARDKLNKIGKAKWYIYDRNDMTSYNDFKNDSDSIANLSKVFPTVFYIIAILISLISMSRMVEDDRMQIGTLKSLGFSNKHIIFKYLIYSGIATIVGGIIGTILGFYIIPNVIWNIYKIIFDVPNFTIDYDLTYILIGILLAIVCICGTTLLTVFKVVKEKPSNLMRPKSPKGGKRVFLERIKFIWNNIKFSNKVTIRNLFRFKKRVIMSVVGILGCTALMLAGFGLRDSIVDIPSTHFGKVFTFNEMIYLDDDFKSNNIFNDNKITDVVLTKMLTGTSGIYNLNVFVPDNTNDIYKIVNLKNIKTKHKIKLVNDKVIITDKLSQLLNKSKGDNITITDNENNSYTYVISNVCENYVGHYVYMTKKTYENTIGTYSSNVAYLKIKNMSQDRENKFASKLMDKEGVMSITSVKNTKISINDMLKSLNSVVLILIVLSAALSFVVMYNLSYININERQREIATLKVLGFTDKEVDNYITKENIILTIMGIILGLICGYFLTNIIIKTVEIDMVRFIHHINIISYVYSALMTIAFTVIVNVIAHFSLKKIDMIESLKSVE